MLNHPLKVSPVTTKATFRLKSSVFHEVVHFSNKTRLISVSFLSEHPQMCRNVQENIRFKSLWCKV